MPWWRRSPARSAWSPVFLMSSFAGGYPICRHLFSVVIYSPARTATQQGSGKLGKWKINFVSTQKWENPLMGWTSTGDPYANVGDSALSFESEAAAKDFAARHGWDYVVVKKYQTPLLKPKSYADNFKFKGLPEAEEK
ncbi:unnamed protein product [Linum tenue]|uniref:NADH dehydrogenase [ubiquinone] iron-sulfur protein 4, mitochondrial n=1 Tax=Linum tenue TaxID=586396 RepID=A0AAV0L909_9ROSI|nr:unnamed protein product [Linum tenue]